MPFFFILDYILNYIGKNILLNIGKFSHKVLITSIVTHAIFAVKNEAKVPANKALNPNDAISPRRFGAIPPIPPSKIPIEPRLAKPHKA